MKSDHFLIVGIGASAGGIEAAKEFFLHVPQDSGMAYVMILHLSPEYESRLAEVLQQTARIPVTQIREKTRVEPDHVYVIPPNRHLQMEDDFIVATPNLNFEERRAPVDIFFRTLANSHQSRAVGVILSGTGANGSMGIKHIKEHGGAAFVQEMREALFHEMPRHSIETGLIDEVLPVAQIPAKIIAYRDSLGKIGIPVEPEERPDEQQQSLRVIFTQLRARTGHDFSNYKQPTVLRRIERRMQVRGIFTLPDYAKYVRENSGEIQALLKDLLISVTNFFRDANAFAHLEKEVLPAIFKDKKAGDQVRIWVAGCATGEEAYSIAILCAELMGSRTDVPSVQIFATDIDETALAIAREGVYTLNDAADVSPERLRRFFNTHGERFRLRNEIRKMILFANHNILKDSPFSHLHLASCRNLLIYLNKQAQQHVMEAFHFALNPGGFLFLSTSESVEGAGDLYVTVSQENRMFQSRQLPVRILPPTEGLPALRLYALKNRSTIQTEELAVPQRVTTAELHHQLIEQYAPPSVVINENHDLLRVSDSAGRFLHLSGGEMSRDILKLIRPELRLELRSALYKALQKRTNIHTTPVSLFMQGKQQAVKMEVRSAWHPADMGKGVLLILFELVQPSTAEERNSLVPADPLAFLMEDDLMRTQEQLRTSSEEHALQSEELKAMNEELQALNEELRSVAEELESGKEELQSLNEELRTVNQELKIKIEEITLSSNNLQNLINSTHIGTIFLDRNFLVVFFTPKACEVVNLISSDVGRSLKDITTKLIEDHVLDDAQTVLETFQPVERESLTTDHRFYIVRLLPYRTSDDHINGVVVTFFDVTERRQMEKSLRDSEENYRIKLEHDVADRTAELKLSRDQYFSLSENTPDTITRWNKDFQLIYANSAFASRTGVPNERLMGLTNTEMGQPADSALSYRNSLQKAFASGEPVEHFNSFETPAGEVQLYSRIVPEKNEKDEIVTLLATARDITELKKAEQEVIRLKDEVAQRAEDRYQVLFNSIDEGFCMFELEFDQEGNAADWVYLEANPAFVKQTGYVDPIGKRISYFQPDLEPVWFEQFAMVVRTGEAIRFTQQTHAMNKWFDVYAFRVEAERKNLVSILFTDVTVRKEVEQDLREREERKEFLLRLSDVLRPLTDCLAIQAVAMQMLAQHLGVTRAQFYEAELTEEYLLSAGGFTDGIWPVAQRISINDLDAYVKTEFHAGRTLAVNDVSLEPRVSEAGLAAYDAPGFRSFIGIPLVKGGRFRAVLGIHHSSPRTWTRGEITVAEATAERTWAAVERVRAEEALRESEERLQLSVRAANLFTWEVDPKTGETKFSGNFNEVLGFEVARISDNNYSNIHPDDSDFVLEALGKAFKNEEPLDVEHRIVNPHTGETIWVKAEGKLTLRNGEPEPVFIGITQNITPRKLAEEAFRKNEALLRHITHNLPAGFISVFDKDLRYVFAEGQGLKDIGISPEQMTGKALAQVIPPEELMQVLPYYRKTFEGEATTFELAQRGHWYAIYTAPLRDANGRINSIITLAQNITERKKLEQQREEFIGIASHELKTPVTSIKAYTELIRAISDEKENAGVAPLVTKLDAQVNRLITLIQDLLDVTKITEGELTLRVQAFDLKQLVEERVDDLRILSSLHHLVVASNEPAMISADRERIAQVLTNFISNAVKYSTGGDIILRWNQSEQGTELSVEDHGIGIPEDLQGKVFDRFFRVKDGSQNTYPGMGLGLYITSSIIRRHGGRIWVKSTPGEGSTFYFSLPKG